jgi:hypothetical protein
MNKQIKGSMQNVAFKTVDQFLDYLPIDELEITLALMEIIKTCMPMAKQKLSWNIPTYSMYKSICFIWPAAVKWGAKNTYSGVKLGFMHGNLLHPANNYFELGNRKMVSIRTFQSIKEIDVAIVTATLLEAMFVDQQFSNKKQR